MSAYIIPILFIALFCYAKHKKVNTYDTFVKGAKKAVPLVIDIFPYIATIMVAVALLRVSGITTLLANALSPVFNLLGIPTELVELVLLRPFTGSGSYALLNDVLLEVDAGVLELRYAELFIHGNHLSSDCVQDVNIVEMPGM